MVENGFEEPENEEGLLDAKEECLSMLYGAVADSIFLRIMMENKANGAWKILRKDYQGDWKVRAIKLQFLGRKFKIRK